MPVKIVIDPTVEEFITSIEVYAPLYTVVMAFLTIPPERPSEFVNARRKLNWFLQTFSMDPIWIGDIEEEHHKRAIMDCVHAYQNSIRFHAN